MLLLWYSVIVASFFSKSEAQKASQEVNGKIKNYNQNLKLNNLMSQNIYKESGDKTPQKVIEDEVWFNETDDDEKDYEFLDIEDDVQHPDVARNYESFLNYIQQAQSMRLSNHDDNSKNDLTSDDSSPNEDDEMIYDSEDDYDEQERSERDIDEEDTLHNLDDLIDDRDDLQFRDSVVKRKDKNIYPYTGSYDHHFATPESELREDRWKTETCVTNLRELYTCIFCSREPAVRQHFLSCYELLPERIKKQGIKCFSQVLTIPFGEGSDDMDYYHLLCKKFKHIELIVECASSLPEFSKEEFIKEEKMLAKYSYCLRGINNQHCC